MAGGDLNPIPRLFDMGAAPPAWTAVVHCKQCGSEMIRIANVPDDKRPDVAVRIAFTVLECPTGCVSDLDETTEWEQSTAMIGKETGE